MYGLLSKLLITGKLKFEQGRITAFDAPFALVPMASIKVMTDDAVKRGSEGIADLYFHGWVYGFVVTKNLIRLFTLKQFEERYKVSMDIVGVTGFGDYKTTDFKRGEYARFTVINNPFAKQYFPSNLHICHYLRGMEAGGGTLVHETLMNCIESECAAKTGKDCVHLNVSQARWEKADQKLVNEQLDIPYLLERQKKLILEQGYSLSDFNIEK